MLPGMLDDAARRPRLHHRLRARRRAHRRTSTARSPAPTAATSSIALEQVLPAPRGRLLVRAHGRRAPHRRARPARLLAARARAGRGRLGARERDRRARHRRRALRARGRARRDDRDRRDRRARDSGSPSPTRSSACSSSSTSPVPTRTSTASSVHAARQRMGEELARQAPVDADMVMPVPESGIPAAQGYARASGIPYGDGLVKNRYVGRTFIQPSQKQRSGGVRLKLNPLPENIRGKRLVVVDDSIVRGTTTKPGGRDAARGRRGRRCTSGCRRRRTSGRASTAWTPAAAPSCSPPTCRWARSATSSASTRSPTSSSTASPRPPARRADSFCTACLSGRLPGAGAARPTRSSCSSDDADELAESEPAS